MLARPAWLLAPLLLLAVPVHATPDARAAADAQVATPEAQPTTPTGAQPTAPTDTQPTAPTDAQPTAPTGAQAPPAPAPDPATIRRDVASLVACSELTEVACPALLRVVAAGDAAVPALRSRLKTGGDASRGRAAAALGLIGTPASVEPLVEALRAPRSTELLIEVADALGKAGRSNPSAALPPLLELLGSSELRDKLSAISALAALHTPECVEPLIAELAFWHPKVQASAATTLGVIGDERAVAPLLELVADGRTVWVVRTATVEALGRLGKRWAAPIVAPMLAHPRPEVRRAAALALGELGATWSAPALLRALKDPDVVGMAALSLGKLADRGAVRPLLEAARDESLPDEALPQVMWAVGAIRDPKALAGLEPLLESNDDRMVYLTAEAMGRIGSPDAADALVALLDSREADLRQIAVWALQEISGETYGADAAAWRRWLSAREEQP